MKTLECFFEVFLIKFLPFVSDIQRRVFSTPAPIVVSTTITTVLPKAPSVVPKRSSVVPKRTSVVPNVTVRPQTSYTVVSTNSPKPAFVSTKSPNTFPILFQPSCQVHLQFLFLPNYQKNPEQIIW